MHPTVYSEFVRSPSWKVGMFHYHHSYHLSIPGYGYFRRIAADLYLRVLHLPLRLERLVGA
jgi:hypothetical protein